jgi:chaperonin cofactor prefoldin
MKTIKEINDSPWIIFERWLLTSDKDPIPEKLLETNAIPHHVILNKFKYSNYIIYLNNLFNTFDIYRMPIEDVYKMTKQCIKLTGFKTPFISPNKSEIEKTKLHNFLKKKFYFLKNYEISSLIQEIDNIPEKDSIYEFFGIYKHKKVKATVDDKKKLEKISVQVRNMNMENLMENFTNAK